MYSSHTSGGYALLSTAQNAHSDVRNRYGIPNTRDLTGIGNDNNTDAIGQICKDMNASCIPGKLEKYTGRGMPDKVHVKPLPAGILGETVWDGRNSDIFLNKELYETPFPEIDDPAERYVTKFFQEYVFVHETAHNNRFKDPKKRMQKAMYNIHKKGYSGKLVAGFAEVVAESDVEDVFNSSGRHDYVKMIERGGSPYKNCYRAGQKIKGSFKYTAEDGKKYEGMNGFIDLLSEGRASAEIIDQYLGGAEVPLAGKCEKCRKYVDNIAGYG